MPHNFLYVAAPVWQPVIVQFQLSVTALPGKPFLLKIIKRMGKNIQEQKYSRKMYRNTIKKTQNKKKKQSCWGKTVS